MRHRLEKARANGHCAGLRTFTGRHSERCSAEPPPTFSLYSKVRDLFRHRHAAAPPLASTTSRHRTRHAYQRRSSGSKYRLPLRSAQSIPRRHRSHLASPDLSCSSCATERARLPRDIDSRRGNLSTCRVSIARSAATAGNVVGSSSATTSRSCVVALVVWG